MMVAVISDTHGNLRQMKMREVIQSKPDVIFLLGDVAPDDFSTIRSYSFFKDVPMFGVVGNHDDPPVLERHGITDLHLNVVNFNGFNLGGYGGAIKYKNDDYFLLHTNAESERELEELPKCDILLCHDKPCFVEYFEDDTPKKIRSFSFRNFIKKSFRISETTEPIPVKRPKPVIVHAHSGLTGIATYIEQKNPKYVFHAHMHANYVTQYENTTIRCCNGIELVEISLPE